MSKLKENKTVLIHSIIWAVLALALAFVIKGNEQQGLIFTFMVGGWYISHATISKKVKSDKIECTNKQKTTSSCFK